MNDSISVFLADDHAIFLDGLSGILAQTPGIEVVGQAQNGAAAWHQLQTQPVDVLVSDIQMPEMDGIRLTQQLKAHRPEQKVLILSMYDDYSVIEQIFDAEAEGYVLKNAGRDEFLKAIHRIHEGSSYYSREVIRILQEERPPQQAATDISAVLSPREIEVLHLICEEYATKEIAEKLFLSPRTIDTHRKHILQKTGVHTLVGLVKWAFRYGLVTEQ